MHRFSPTRHFVKYNAAGPDRNEWLNHTITFSIEIAESAARFLEAKGFDVSIESRQIQPRNKALDEIRKMGYGR